MVDIIRFGIRVIIELDDLADDANEVFEFEEFHLLLAIELKALIHLVTTDLGKVVTIGTMEHRVDEAFRGIGACRITRAQATINLNI